MKKNVKAWLRAAAVRAVRTVAQTAIALIGTSALMGEVKWLTVLSAAALSGILSVLTSLAGLPEITPEDGGSTPLAGAENAGDAGEAKPEGGTSEPVTEEKHE